MHHIHRTRALVLQNRPSKEADMHVTLLTEDVGVIRAVAQGSRKMESKMRQSIQTYSFVHVALVLGRTGWRLVNALFIKNIHRELTNEHARRVLCSLCGFIERFIVDELEDRDIFEMMESFFEWAKQNQGPTSVLANMEHLQSFEVICMCRLLHNFGYIQENADINTILHPPLSVELVHAVTSGMPISRTTLILEINRAIRDSHL